MVTVMTMLHCMCRSRPSCYLFDPGLRCATMFPDLWIVSVVSASFPVYNFFNRYWIKTSVGRSQINPLPLFVRAVPPCHAPHPCIAVAPREAVLQLAYSA